MNVSGIRPGVGFYSAGFPDSTSLRRKINSAGTLDEFMEILTKWGV